MNADSHKYDYGEIGRNHVKTNMLTQNMLNIMQQGKKKKTCE